MSESSDHSSKQLVAQFQARIAELEQQVAIYEHAASSVGTARDHARYSSLLGMILEISAALRFTHDVPTVLALIEQKIPLLFNRHTHALFFLIDEQQRLSSHTSNTYTAEPLVISKGQGIAGRGFLAPRAMLFANEVLQEANQELQLSQQDQLQQMLGAAWPPRTAIAISLRGHEQLVGVLTLYNGSTTMAFTPFDLPFVQALADLAAVAIVDAQQRVDLTQVRAMHARAQAQLDSAQAQLLQSARLAAVGELSASVAHEINNPLYAARNSLFLAARKLTPDSTSLEYVKLAQDELGRIARIISRMRDFYRPTRAEMEPTDLNQLIEETLALVQTHLRHGRVQVAFEPDAQLPPVIVSADQIRQVILNLILNACDAMAEHGGTLTVRSVAVDSRSRSGAEAPQRTSLSHFVTEILIIITDTGIGIPPEIIAQLFTPFFTTKAHGTGLGLAISGHIVTQHGGHISVVSTPGQGSTFTIRLPLDGHSAALLNPNNEA